MNDLLKEKKEDFDVVDGRFVEKNRINGYDSLHTKKLQRSDYLKLDDNVLNLKKADPSQNLSLKKKKKSKSTEAEKTLSDKQIQDLKQEIKRVQVKYVD